MNEQPKPCPVCRRPGERYDAHKPLAGCTSEECVLFYGEFGLELEQWNALPRQSDIDAAVKAEQERCMNIYEKYCEGDPETWLAYIEMKEGHEL